MWNSNKSRSSSNNYHKKYRSNSNNNSTNRLHVLSDDQIGTPYIPQDDFNNSYLVNSTIDNKRNNSVKINKLSSNSNNNTQSHRRISNSKGDLLINDIVYSDDDEFDEDFNANDNYNYNNNQLNNPTHILQTRNDIGNPIPLPYMERQKTMMNNARNNYQKPVILNNKNRKQSQNKTKKSTDTLKNSNTSEKLKQYTTSKHESSLNDCERQIQVTIKATNEKDIVRICNSILREYESEPPKTIVKVILFFLLFIVIVFLSIYYIYYLKQ